MSKLYCEPEEDVSFVSFIELQSNINLQLKRKKVTEKKTPLPKDYTTTKILSRQKANDETEIDSN